MSDTRDETTGQFTSAEPLVGERAAEATAGYIPAVEAPTEKGADDPRDLSEKIAEARGHDPEATPEPVLGLTDPDDTGPKQAITQEQLVESLAEKRVEHEAAVQRRGNEEIAEYANNLRAYLHGADLEGQAAPETPPLPAETPQAEAIEGLHPDVAKALQHPQVREAIEAELNEAGRQREAFTNSLQAGQQMLQATVSALAPQLDGMPVEQWPQAIQMLHQVDPVRANLVADTLTKWGAIQQAQQQMQQQQAHVAHQQFETNVKAEDARLTEMFDGNKAIADEANDATISYLAEHGIPRQQMAQVFKSNPVLTTAEARRTIWEAAKYREIQKAKVVAAAKPAPSVQRPGIAPSAGEREASATEAKMSQIRTRIAQGKSNHRDLGNLISIMRTAR